MADELQYGLVNQSVGAQVFQESSLGALPVGMDPSLVIVALGANYRYGRCNERVTGREIASYLARADELWPSVPLVVIVPAKQPGREAVRGSCYECVADLIDEAAAREAPQARRERSRRHGAARLRLARGPAQPRGRPPRRRPAPRCALRVLRAAQALVPVPARDGPLWPLRRLRWNWDTSARSLSVPIWWRDQKRGGRKAKAAVAAAIEPKPEVAPVLANAADTEAEATSVSAKVEAAKPTKPWPVSAKVEGDEPVKPASVSANKPTRRAAAVEDTPVGQTISMFTLLDE